MSNTGGSSSIWTNPTLVILDSMNGSGYAEEVVGTVTADFDRTKLRIDAKGAGYGYSWSEVAGGGDYSADHTIIPKA